jgi:hypothetical protein
MARSAARSALSVDRQAAEQLRADHQKRATSFGSPRRRIGVRSTIVAKRPRRRSDMDDDEVSTNDEGDSNTGNIESWLAEQVRLITLEDGLS